MLTALLCLLPLCLGDDLAERRKAAGNDVDKLFELALWCEGEGRDKDQEDLCERILKLAPDHAGAHEKLRHHRYGERWFATYRELSAYKRAEEERMAAQGLARFGDGWAPRADVPFLRMGWAKDADGRFQSQAANERARVAAERTAAGWQQQDLTWVPPEEFEPWRAGLFKCGDVWLDASQADAWHAQLGRPWQLPGERFVVHSTLPREQARWALWWADQTYADLERAAGPLAGQKPLVVTLASLAQYNDFAAGNAAALRPAAEASGYSSFHYAFLADSYVDATGAAPEYLGAAAAYWESSDAALAPYGQHAVRHAAALAYLEALDPSWNAVADMLAAGPGAAVNSQDFWAEKRIALWLRFGIASYCERYFRDPHAAEGQDKNWARTWALANLREKGGLRALEELFAFVPDPTDPEGAARWIAESGALVSFVLDGGVPALAEAHGRWRAALASGGDLAGATRALEQELAQAGRELARYLGS
jgi:hypothetical protein